MIISRYLASHILKGTFMVLMIIVGLSFFFNLIRELGDVGRGEYGLSQMFQYLLFISPGMFIDYMPLAALIGAMLSLGNLASNSELIAIQSSGFSVRKFIQAVTQTVLVLALFSFLLADFVVPYSEFRGNQIRASSIASSISTFSRKGVWIKDGQNIIVIGQLYPNGNAENIDIYYLDKKDTLIKASHARKAINSESGWILHEVNSSTFLAGKVSASLQKELVYDGSLSDKLLESLAVNPRQMAITDLYAYIDFLKNNSLNSDPESLAFWRKIYAPFTIIVMGVLAIPFVLGSQRESNTGQRLMIGILLGLLYVVLNRLLIQLGEQLKVVAYVNALLPTLIFMVITAWLIYKKTKMNR
jgi:lipopolysaccharide export system permease protein